ncbi:MAG: hypothetical protein OEZ06_31000 [Myxococcales bacterium]|nr:hypothetical protein [Myxococcales bacterium]
MLRRARSLTRRHGAEPGHGVRQRRRHHQDALDGQPVFAAAFLGAPSLGVHIFDPDTTRALTTLLLCHDLLNPEAPCASGNLQADPNAKVAAVLSQQIHGGLYGLPYELYPAIRAAAILGLGKRPSMLPKLLRG